MKKCFLVYPSLRVYYIVNILKRYGYEIVSLDLYNSELNILKSSKRLLAFSNKNFLLQKEINHLNNPQQILSWENRKKIKTLDQLETCSFDDFKLNRDDKIFCFEERHLFETSMISNNTFLRPRDALTLSCKHIIYKKLNKKFFIIKNINDFNNVPNMKYIIKPSLNSMGKRNVFTLEHNKDYEKILIKDKDIFSFGRPFILEPYIEHVCEIWVMTLFDKDKNPYILWFSTEKGHATFSPLDEDIKLKIQEINTKLKIRSWMAFIQFLLDKDGNLHFVDLNPRLPGDDDWHELLYKYLTGKSFAKTIIDLLLFNKKPDIIKSNKYILEEEYNPNYEVGKNQKIWKYSDNYKKIPLWTFKKLDLYQNN